MPVRRGIQPPGASSPALDRAGEDAPPRKLARPTATTTDQTRVTTADADSPAVLIAPDPKRHETVLYNRSTGALVWLLGAEGEEPFPLEAGATYTHESTGGLYGYLDAAGSVTLYLATERAVR